jgi:hypothetical protein
MLRVTNNKKIATDSRKKLLKILTRAQRTDAVNKFRIKKAPNYFDAQI